MRNAETAFVALPAWVRIGTISYVLLYRLLFPALAVSADYHSVPLLFERILVETLFTFLLLFPFFFYRKEYGYLHPLIFPLLFTLAKQGLQNPLHLIAPMKSPVISFAVETSSQSEALRYLTPWELAEARIELTLLYCFTISAYYLAFFYAPRLSVPKINFRQPQALVPKTLLIIGLATATVLAFLAMRGGITAHILSLTRPRYETLAGLGQFAEFAAFAILVTAIWFAYDKRALARPLFYVALVTAAFDVLIIAGARSEVVYFLILLITIEILKHNKVPYSRAIIVGAFAIILFGAVGLLRSDWNAKQVDWSTFTNFDTEAWVEKAAAEIKMRKNEEPDLAAFVNIDKAGYLHGKTYVGAIFFWLPRAIWPGKPRSADSYNSYVNFDGGSLEDELPDSSGSIPLGPELEAYWNFHLPGVLLLSVLMGMFHRWIASCLTLYRQVPAMWILYTFALFNFTGSSLSFVNTIRGLVSIVIILFFMGVFRLLSAQRPIQNMPRPANAFVRR